MYSAAELIEAVQRKLRVSARRGHPVGEFPPGWREWFAAMAERVGEVTGATSQAMVAVFLQRPLAITPRNLALMTRWQAFSSVWRQQWQTPSREERGMRWLSGGLSALLHMLLGVLLLWLLYVPTRIASPPPEGETVVQVEFIGTGTPEEIGGGPAAQTSEPVEEAAIDPAAQPGTAQSTAPMAAAPLPALRIDELAAPVEVPVPETPVPQVAQRETPTPPAPAPPAEQPLTVSAPAPDADDVFVLPPTTSRIREPVVTARELSATIPTVRDIDIPEPFQPPASTPRVIQPQTTAPALSQRIPEVSQREIPVPLPRAIARELPPRPIAAPELRSTVP
ncbi:MAG: hypothetical protein M3374_03905, partial [Pseudomonadota bacterium]|nr:hypothetical protein [Pseudomonadota bacterium]